MKKRRCILFFIFAILSCTPAYSWENVLGMSSARITKITDSLLLILPSLKHDTIQLALFGHYTESLYLIKDGSSIAERLYAVAEAKHYYKGTAVILLGLGAISKESGDYNTTIVNTAINNYSKAITLLQKIGNYSDNEINTRDLLDKCKMGLDASNELMKTLK